MTLAIPELHASHTASGLSPAAADRGAATGLRAVVLFDGGVRRSPFLEMIDRSPLDLPVNGEGRTILSLWHERLEALARRLGLQRLHCRLALGRGARAPLLGEPRGPVRMTVDPDPGELRGTGGLARDLSEAYADDDLVLLAAAAQLMLHPVEEIVCEAISGHGAPSVVCDLEHSPSNLVILAARCLRSVAPHGFVDLKEQVLPMVARRWGVQMHRPHRRLGVSVRTPAGYLRALRELSQLPNHPEAPHNPFQERWASSFAIVEPGADVHPTARLHDAVVLRGASVGPGAVIASSILCPGARVARGARMIGQLVTPASHHVIDGL